jgi:hypothetical protein
VFLLPCIAFTFLQNLSRPYTSNINQSASNTTGQSNSALTGTTQTPPPLQTTNKKSSDYKAGYNKGFHEGKSWATETDGGMPYPIAIEMMAKHQAEVAGASDREAWQSGWEKGFTEGYRSVKQPKIKEEALEPLSWGNAKVGVKLYDNDGNYEVTIIGVDKAEGLITVKYPQDRGGVIEDKLLGALSQLWFVRKDDPALHR